MQYRIINLFLRMKEIQHLRFAESFEDHIAALRNKDHQVLRTDAPFEEKRHAAALWFEGKKHMI